MKQLILNGILRKTLHNFLYSLYSKRLIKTAIINSSHRIATTYKNSANTLPEIKGRADDNVNKRPEIKRMNRWTDKTSAVS